MNDNVARIEYWSNILAHAKVVCGREGHDVMGEIFAEWEACLRELRPYATLTDKLVNARLERGHSTADEILQGVALKGKVEVLTLKETLARGRVLLALMEANGFVPAQEEGQ